MFISIVSVALVAFIALFFIWLTRRAFRARRPIIKWVGGILSGLLALLTVLITLVALIGLVKYYTPKSHAVQDLKVEGTPEQIARGQHLAAAFCVECHSTTADFPMTGGVDLGADIPMNIGSYVSVNLTPAGPLKDWTDGEIFRAIRDNVDKDGNRLVFMGNTNVRHISDEDIHALIAFLRSQEAVERPSLIPPDHPNSAGFHLIWSGHPARCSTDRRRGQRPRQDAHGGIRQVHDHLFGLHRLSWERPERRDKPGGTERPEFPRGQGLDAAAIYRYTAHRPRPAGG